MLTAYPSTASEFYPDELRAMVAGIKTALTTTVRVDENNLRRRQVDTLPELLAKLSGEERRLVARGVIERLALPPA